MPVALASSNVLPQIVEDPASNLLAKAHSGAVVFSLLVCAAASRDEASTRVSEQKSRFFMATSGCKSVERRIQDIYVSPPLSSFTGFRAHVGWVLGLSDMPIVEMHGVSERAPRRWQFELVGSGLLEAMHLDMFGVQPLSVALVGQAKDATSGRIAGIEREGCIMSVVVACKSDDVLQGATDRYCQCELLYIEAALPICPDGPIPVPNGHVNI